MGSCNCDTFYSPMDEVSREKGDYTHTQNYLTNVEYQCEQKCFKGGEAYYGMR